MQNKKEFKDKDAEKYMEILPEYQVKALEKQYKETDKDYEETLLDNFETSRENLEDTYGDNAKVSYKILDKTKLTDDEIDDIEDSIKSNYDKKVDVKEGYKCFVKYTKKGKEDESVSYTTRTVIKVDGKWCAWNA